jgi:hypothetical protein
MVLLLLDFMVVVVRDDSTLIAWISTTCIMFIFLSLCVSIFVLYALKLIYCYESFKVDVSTSDGL